MLLAEMMKNRFVLRNLGRVCGIWNVASLNSGRALSALSILTAYICRWKSGVKTH